MAKKKLPQRDPIAAYVHESQSERKFEPGSKCDCGEFRPDALIPGTKPVICAACNRRKLGHAVMDNHHVAAEANHPGTLPIYVNDHRSELNVAQYDWPKETRENPHRSPLLAAAGCIRGLCDTILYLIETFLHWIAVFLEQLDSYLTDELGNEWWANTEINKYAPKSKV